MLPTTVLTNKPLALGSVSTLILGSALLCIPALAQGIFSIFVFAFGKNMDLLLYVNIMSNMVWINAVPPVVGGVLLCYVASRFIRSHYRVDYSRIKKQTLHLSSWILIASVAVSCFVAFGLPTSKAMNTATTGYILDTPVSDFDYLVGNYSDSTSAVQHIYAINGSTWDNLMGGVGSTAWSAYTANYTKVTELALQSLSSGKILLKNVAFDVALMNTIPVNVTVVCSYGSQDYAYINPLSDEGSTIAVSVGVGLNGGYYTSEDSKGRINRVSTNSTQVLQDSATSLLTGETLVVRAGLYPCYGLSLNDYTTLELEAGAILRLPNNQTLSPEKSNVIYINRDAYNITICGEGMLDGNTAGNLWANYTGIGHCGIVVYFSSQAVNIKIDGVTIVNGRIYGVDIKATAGKTSTNNWITNAVIMDNGYNDVTFEAFDQTSVNSHSGVLYSTLGGATGDISVATYTTNVSAPTVGTTRDIWVVGCTIKPLTGLLGSSNPVDWFGIKFERQSIECHAINNIIEGACTGIADDYINSNMGQHEIIGNDITLKDCNDTKGYPNYGILLCQNKSTAAFNSINGPSTLAQAWNGVRSHENVSYSTVFANTITDYKGAGATIGLREYGVGGTFNVWQNNLVIGCDTNATLSGVSYIVNGNRYIP